MARRRSSSSNSSSLLLALVRPVLPRTSVAACARRRCWSTTTVRRKADIAVVLAGDSLGQPRSARPPNWCAQGYVPAVLVSGPPYLRRSTSATRRSTSRCAQGYPAEWFIPLPNAALSTREEARGRPGRAAAPQRPQLPAGDQRLSHRRAPAASIARRERAIGRRPAMRVVAAPDQYFQPRFLVANRARARRSSSSSGRKTLATAVGI